MSEPPCAPTGDDKVWTAEELLAMSPDERHRVVKAGFVYDLDEVSPGLLKRARENLAAYIRESDISSAEQA